MLFYRISLFALFCVIVVIISSVFYIPDNFCNKKSDSKIDTYWIINGYKYDIRNVHANSVIEDYKFQDISNIFYSEWNCPGINDPLLLWDLDRNENIPKHSLQSLQNFPREKFYTNRGVKLYDKFYNIEAYFKNNIRIFDTNMDIIFQEIYDNNTEIMDYLLSQDFVYYQNVLNCMDNLFLSGFDDKNTNSDCLSDLVLTIIFTVLCFAITVVYVFMLYCPNYSSSMTLPNVKSIVHVPIPLKSICIDSIGLLLDNIKKIKNACLCDLSEKTILITVPVMHDTYEDIQVFLDSFNILLSTEYISFENINFQIYKIENIIIVLDYSNTIDWISELMHINDTLITFFSYNLKFYLNQEYVDVYLGINPYLTILNYKCIHNILDPFINDSSVTGVFCNPDYTCNSITDYQNIFYNMSQKIKSFRGNAEESRDIFAYRIKNIGADVKNIYINQKIGILHSINSINSTRLFSIHNFNLSSIFSLMFASIHIYQLFLFIKIFMFSDYGNTNIVLFILYITFVTVHFCVVVSKFTYYTKPKDYVLFVLFSVLKMLLLPIVFISRLILKNPVVAPLLLEKNEPFKKSIINWKHKDVFNDDYTDYNYVNSDSIIYKSNVSESSIYNMYFGSKSEWSSTSNSKSNSRISIQNSGEEWSGVKKNSFVKLTNKEKGVF
jgi:hypothetical protein